MNKLDTCRKGKKEGLVIGSTESSGTLKNSIKRENIGPQRILLPPHIYFIIT